MKKPLIAGVAVVLGAALTGGFVIHSAQAGPTTWAPTSAQADRAAAAAQRVADLSNPDKSATVASRGGADATAGWPANVTSVSMVASTRSQASPFLDGSTGWDDRDVVIVQMTGQFVTQVKGFGPESPSSFTASEVTLVIDAVTGKTLDSASYFAGSGDEPATPPGMAVTYQRQP